MTIMQSLSSFVTKHSIEFSFKNSFPNFTVEGEEDSLDLMRSFTAPGGTEEKLLTRSRSEESCSTCEVAASCSSSSRTGGDSQASEGADDTQLEQNISNYVEKHGITMSFKNGFQNFTVEGEEDSLDLMRSFTAPGGTEKKLLTRSQSEESGSTCEVAASCSSSSSTGGDSQASEGADDTQLEQNISNYVEKQGITMSFKNGFQNFTVEGEEDSLDLMRSFTAPDGMEESTITRSHSSHEESGSIHAFTTCCPSSISGVEHHTEEDTEDTELDPACDWFPGPGLVDKCLPGAAGVSSILKLRSEGCKLEVLQWVIDPEFDHQKSRLQRFSSAPFNASLPGFEGKLQIVMRGVNEKNPELSKKFSQVQGRRLMLRRALNKDDKTKSSEAIGEEVSVQFRIGAGRGLWSETANQITTTIDPKKGEVREACFDNGFPVVENGPLVIQVAIRLEELC